MAIDRTPTPCAGGCDRIVGPGTRLKHPAGFICVHCNAYFKKNGVFSGKKATDATKPLVAKRSSAPLVVDDTLTGRERCGTCGHKSATVPSDLKRCWDTIIRCQDTFACQMRTARLLIKRPEPLNAVVRQLTEFQNAAMQRREIEIDDERILAVFDA